MARITSGALEMDALYRALLEEIGEDPEREGLLDTPRRAAAALRFLTSGYRQDISDLVTDFSSETDEMIIVQDIELYSLCEHHMLPFIGKAHVAYLPQGRIIGVSKIPRIVDMFARRLQVQEELTRQVASTLMEAVGAKGVGVVIEA